MTTSSSPLHHCEEEVEEEGSGDWEEGRNGVNFALWQVSQYESMLQIVMESP